MNRTNSSSGKGSYSPNVTQPSSSDPITELEGKIKSIVGSRQFYYLGIGKAALIEHIQQLSSEINPSKEAQVERIQKIFDNDIKGKISEKIYEDLEYKLKDEPGQLHFLLGKIDKIVSTSKYRLFGLGRAEAEQQIGKLQKMNLANIPPEDIRSALTSINSLLKKTVWKSTRNALETLKGSFENSGVDKPRKENIQISSPLESFGNDLPQENKDRVERKNAGVVELKDGKGNIQKPSVVFKNPNFVGTITLNQESFNVRRGGVNQRGEVVGAGAFGCLLYTEPKRGVPQKVIKVTRITGNTKKEKEKCRERVQREANLCLQMKDSNYVLGAEDVVVTEEASYILMECLPQGDLFDKLRRGTIPLRKKIGYALNALQGLKEIHNKGFLHKDIKPENMLLDKEQVKLIDLGLAEEIGGKKLGGTSKYISPEVLYSGFSQNCSCEISEKVKQAYDEGFSEAVDVYSWGVFLVELLIDPLPQQFESQYLPYRLQQSIKIDCPRDFNQTEKSLIEIANKCLDIDPKNRPTVDNLIILLKTFLL